MNIFKKSISCLFVGLIALAATDSQASNLICDTSETNDDFVVGFFNGVGNSELQAQLSLAQVARIYGSEHEGLTIKYEPFYNHTGSSLGSNTGQDLVEVFRQRADELDPSGYLSKRFELFYAMKTNDSGGLINDVINTIGTTNQVLKGAIEDLYTDVANEVLAQVGELYYNPPTITDYNIHSSRIASLSAQGSRMLFVAHSQGNLFANAAYDYTLGLSNMSSSNVGVLHIAPATTTTNGTHVLADKDVVINGLRLTGTVPDITVEIPATHLLTDISGHGFIKTYMEQSLDTYGQVKDAYDVLLGSLTAPEQLAQSGAFTATLTWDGIGDVDLHTFESTGTQVYYRRKTGDVGYLDLDNTYANGPEHYYTSCDNTSLMEGQFTFGVNNYARAEGRTATVQISTPNVANVITRSVVLGTPEGSSGNANPEILISVTIEQSDSGLVLSAQ